MELQTISRVSKDYGISARMLRYYEQAGLIESKRREDYAYRVYDEKALTRLRQIIVLRKLRVSVKQIITILNNPSAAEAVEIFRQNINRLDEEITALSAVKSILVRFVEEINEKADVWLDILNGEAALAVISSLPFSDNQIKKNREDLSMEELNKADARLSRLADRDVRIIYIPPSEVASYRYEGADPEAEVGRVIREFVKESRLAEINPQIRNFGFNSPNPKDGSDYHGYESWVTIPDGFDVPAPLVKKHFPGGMYCAHMIPMGAFDEWQLLSDWVDTGGGGKYEYRGDGSPDNMFGSLEECLNYISHYDEENWDGVQLDLLIPVRRK